MKRTSSRLFRHPLSRIADGFDEETIKRFAVQRLLHLIDAVASPLGGIGNLGRNVLRGPNQKRFDASLSKTTRITEKTDLEFRWEVFNVLNNVNFANPSNDLQDKLDFGTISNTVGGPRVMQFGLKLRF